MLHNIATTLVWESGTKLHDVNKSIIATNRASDIQICRQITKSYSATYFPPYILQFNN